MPRHIEERWTAVGFDVITENVQKADPKDGKPLFDGHGLPQMEELITLILICPQPDGQIVLRVPFNAEAKQVLISKLTGGIVIAPNGSQPHLPLGKGV